jgi:hypothetical protein
MTNAPETPGGAAELSTSTAERTGTPAHVCTNRACERRDPKVDHARIARDAVTDTFGGHDA